MIDPALLARMSDLAEKSIRAGTAYSKFLTAAEAEDVRIAFKNRRDITVTFDGGFADAERTIAIFTNPDWGEYQRDEVLAALCIKYRKHDSLGHRDILGSALGLGIDRAVLGDIYIGEPSYIICLAGVASFICDEMKQAGRVGLAVTRVPLSDLPQIIHRLEERTDTVALPRTPPLIAAGARPQKHFGDGCVYTVCGTEPAIKIINLLLNRLYRFGNLLRRQTILFLKIVLRTNLTEFILNANLAHFCGGYVFQYRRANGVAQTADDVIEYSKSKR